MEHDELVAEISLASRGEYASLAVALIAVVALHKPDESKACVECSGDDYGQMYPCDTIQAIEKELSNG